MNIHSPESVVINLVSHYTERSGLGWEPKLLLQTGTEFASAILQALIPGLAGPRTVTWGTALKAVVTKPAKINLPAAPILCQVILHRHLGKTAVPLSSSRTSTLHQSTFLFPGWDSVTSSTDGLWWEWGLFTTMLWNKTEASTWLPLGTLGSRTCYHAVRKPGPHQGHEGSPQKPQLRT